MVISNRDKFRVNCLNLRTQSVIIIDFSKQANITNLCKSVCVGIIRDFYAILCCFCILVNLNLECVYFLTV